MRLVSAAAVVWLVCTCSLVWAQEVGGEHPGHEEPGEQESPPAAERSGEHGVGGEHARMEEFMTGPLGLSWRRYGSGTAWQPGSTPMFGHMLLLGGGWGTMFHYNAFAGVDAQGSAQGETDLVGIGWAMGMVRGPVLGGQLTGRLMLSPEPWLQGRRGYPLLLQTGETAFDRPLVDRQHPHDLFMELALLYNRALGEDLAFELYLAPSGEPALGPMAYPHRVSAFADPLAPIGHHWQDSSHITFGVVTGALYTRWAKLEVSAFNGVEPGEERFGIDLQVPDSVSGRVSVAPGEEWVLQASAGYLAEPELLEPEESLVRLGATAMYNRRLGEQGNWAATLVWGQNRQEEGPATNSLLLESSLWLGEDVFFGRAEYVEKTAHDFDLEELDEDLELPVGSLVLGYARQFGPFAGLVPGVGVRGSVGLVGHVLRERYDTRFPVGGMVYLWLRPEVMGHVGPTSTALSLQPR